MYSVVPVISAMSWRDTGKSISTTAFTRRPAYCTTQQCARDAPLDPLGHELAMATLQVMQSPGDELDGVEGDSGFGLQQLRMMSDVHTRATAGSTASAPNRIGGIAKRPSAAEGVSGADDAEDHLLSSGVSCVSFTRPLVRTKNASAPSPSFEKELTCTDRFRVRTSPDACEGVGSQSLKQRYAVELVANG